MRAIAEDQGISLKYLHSILTVLKNAGLVRSVRGASGGYTLTRPPSRIRVSEVFRALEGSLSLVECVGDEKLCTRADGCPAREVWLELSSALDSTLSNLTLGDVIVRTREREVGAAMYNI
jgi:Rrf2 family protein